jgi:hypothetical protein
MAQAQNSTPLPGQDPQQQNWRRIARVYGLTKEGYFSLLTAQEKRCAICWQVPAKLFVDHCHRTGKVRGLLCPRCNTGLSYFSDNADALVCAAYYLDFNDWELDELEELREEAFFENEDWLEALRGPAPLKGSTYPAPAEDKAKQTQKILDKENEPLPDRVLTRMPLLREWLGRG